MNMASSHRDIITVYTVLSSEPRRCFYGYTSQDSKVHEAYMGPTWGRQDPGGPHVGPVNLAIWVALDDVKKYVFTCRPKWKRIAIFNSCIREWIYEFSVKTLVWYISLLFILDLKQTTESSIHRTYSQWMLQIWRSITVSVNFTLFNTFVAWHWFTFIWSYLTDSSDAIM